MECGLETMSPVNKNNEVVLDIFEYMNISICHKLYLFSIAFDGPSG